MLSIVPLLCLAAMLLAQVSFQINGRSNACCLKFSRDVLRKTDVKNYTIQTAGDCTFDAIIFKKKSGGTTCSDPQKPWVKRAMQYVDGKKAAANKMAKHESFTSTSADMGSGNELDDLRTTTPDLYFNTVIGRSLCPCLKTSDVVLPYEDIRSYKIHDVDVCHIHTIEFETVRGVTFCSNPQEPWVKGAMQYVDKKKAADKTTHSLNSISMFKSGPALYNTSHGNGQDELERNGMKSTSAELKTQKVTICL